MPRPKQRTPELAERVLRAGVELLGREGVDALTARRLARAAGTSPAAIYELFGDKAGVVRALFFAGFEHLAAGLGEPGPAARDPGALLGLAQRYRGFVVANPAWSALMFSRPFAQFDPGPDELAAGAAVRGRITAAIDAAIERGALSGDTEDIAHAYVALIQGLAAAESAHRLGSSEASVARRWELGVRALLRGFAPATPTTRARSSS